MFCIPLRSQFFEFPVFKQKFSRNYRFLELNHRKLPVIEKPPLQLGKLYYGENFPKDLCTSSKLSLKRGGVHN
jgi:hypothetical protein